jgi:hypothetical protein
VWKKSRERLARAKDVVFSEMANRGRYHYAEQIIEEMYGHWYAEFFYSGNRASHEGQIARGERTNRGRDSEKVRVKNGKASREVDNEIFRGYAIPKIKDGNYFRQNTSMGIIDDFQKVCYTDGEGSRGWIISSFPCGRPAAFFFCIQYCRERQRNDGHQR